MAFPMAGPRREITFQHKREQHTSGIQVPIPWMESPYFLDGQPRSLGSSTLTSSSASGNDAPSFRSHNSQPHFMGWTFPQEFKAPYSHQPKVSAYTPMLHSIIFSENHKYRAEEFTTCKEDRSLFVQFCANDPDILLEAARRVEPYCDYVDINLVWIYFSKRNRCSFHEKSQVKKDFKFVKIGANLC